MLEDKVKRINQPAMRYKIILFLFFPIICFGQVIRTDSAYWIYLGTDTILQEWLYIEDTTDYKYLYIDDNGYVKMGEGIMVCKNEVFYDGTPIWANYECKYFIRKNDIWIECEQNEYQFLIPKP